MRASSPSAPAAESRREGPPAGLLAWTSGPAGRCAWAPKAMSATGSGTTRPAPLTWHVRLNFRCSLELRLRPPDGSQKTPMGPRETVTRNSRVYTLRIATIPRLSRSRDVSGIWARWIQPAKGTGPTDKRQWTLFKLHQLRSSVCSAGLREGPAVPPRYASRGPYRPRPLPRAG